MTKAERRIMLDQFANKLKAVRYMTGHSNRCRLAEKVGISDESLALYEKGWQAAKPNKQLPPFDVVIRLAMACKVDINELVPDNFTVSRSQRGTIYKLYIQYMLESYFAFANETERKLMAQYCTMLYQKKKEDMPCRRTKPSARIRRRSIRALTGCPCGQSSALTR